MAPKRTSKQAFGTKKEHNAGGNTKQETLDSDSSPQVNQKTGRPIRTSAGKRSSISSAYINTDDAVFQETESTASEPEVDEESGHLKKRKLAKNGNKTKPSIKAKSPPPPPLSPVPSDDSSLSSPSSSLSSPSPFHAAAPKAPSNHNVGGASFKVNIPPGHQGPLTIRLAVETAALGQLITTPPRSAPRSTDTSACEDLTSSDTEASMSEDASPSPKNRARRYQTGFLDLPYELRLVIYREVFVTEKPIKLLDANTFPRGGALLMTNRMVYLEGRIVLYGENKFCFERQFRSRATYKQAQWREVGFKDLRHFLNDIGVTNVSYMRHIMIHFEDGIPSGNPQHSQNELRYVHDENLIDCIRCFAQWGMLQKLELCMHGRKMLTLRDERFLNHLKKVRADTVEFINSQDMDSGRPGGLSYWVRSTMPRIHHKTKDYLKSRMTRSLSLPDLMDRFDAGTPEVSSEEARVRSVLEAQLRPRV